MNDSPLGPMPASRIRPLRDETRRAIAAEVERARSIHPTADFAALVSEVGELAEVYTDGEGRERERAEALQVACVALRIFEEGDGRDGR